MAPHLAVIHRGRQQPASLEALLSGDFRLSIAGSLESALDVVHKDRPLAIVIVEDETPEAVLSALQSVEASRMLPVVVVGGRLSPQREAALLDAGAEEWLADDCEPSICKSRIHTVARRALKVRNLEGELEKMNSFVKTVTHDLKNPMGAIISRAELLEVAVSQNDIDEALDLIKGIRQCGENALDFIQDLLGLLREGTQVLRKQEVPAAEIIRESLASLDLKIRNSKAVVEVAPDLPTIFCDRNRMVQAFVNVIDNAVKYVARGMAPRVKITSLNTPHSNTIVVSDNGIGMDVVDTKRIFQSFVRLPDADPFPGTGLGLAIVRRIVEAHDGEVFARSHRGKGSEIHIMLPTQQAVPVEVV